MKFGYAIILCLFTYNSFAENRNDTAKVIKDTSVVLNDTILKQHQNKIEKHLDWMASSKLYQMTYASVPLITFGLIAKNKDDQFRKLRNDYLPQYRRYYDNYMQYIPIVALYGMKIGGVESRSSWSRMLVSDAFSTAIMGIVVNTLKNSTNVTRPDGADNHSFPSGHTAMAFMSATMFSKEYGGRYPWLSIGAYTVASATGLFRIANNKHWLSDVMTGAGIGILSTEVGYYLADLIFRDKGLNRKEHFDVSFDKTAKPSFAGIYLGFSIPLSHYDINDKLSYKTSSGSTSGIEGAYFFNPYIGVGGRMTFSDVAIYLKNDEEVSKTFRFSSLDAGCYFSYPLSSRIAIGSKAVIGYTQYSKLELPDRTFPTEGGVDFGSGLSLTFRARERLSFRLFADYDLIPPHSDNTREYMNTIAIGGMVAVTF